MSLSTSSSGSDDTGRHHDDGAVPFPITGSDLYQSWMEERLHVLRNKYFLSEKLGFDCGWDHAFWDWNMRHRKAWLATRREQTPPT